MFRDLGLFTTSMEDPLFGAVKQKNVAKVKELLADSFFPVDINKEDKYGWTPLHYAAFLNDVEMVGSLLTSGAQKSVDHPAYPANASTIENIINQFRFNNGETPLMLTTSAAVAAMLLRAGATLSAQDAQGWNALHWAMFRSNPLSHPSYNLAVMTTLIREETSFALLDQVNKGGLKPVELSQARELVWPLVQDVIHANQAVQALNTVSQSFDAYDGEVYVIDIESPASYGASMV